MSVPTTRRVWIYEKSVNSVDAWSMKTESIPSLGAEQVFVETLLVSVGACGCRAPPRSTDMCTINRSLFAHPASIDRDVAGAVRGENGSTLVCHRASAPVQRRKHRSWIDCQNVYVSCVRVFCSERVDFEVLRTHRDFCLQLSQARHSGWQTHAVCDAADAEVIDPSLIERVGVEQQLAALGMVGRTAFFGVESALEPKEGETALVTGAAGAVGSIVVQLLKARGVGVIGTAGSDEKCELLQSLGADVAINYRTTKLDAKNTATLAAAAPDGIDVFFDNVGGDVFDCAIQLMNVHSRIAICGQISQYDDLDEPQMGPRFLVSRRA